MKINELVEKAHANAVDKGFWDKPRETGTLIALIHSEVTEALDADNCQEFCDELADICIRIADLCGGQKINLETVLENIGQEAEADGFKLDTSSLYALEKSFREHADIPEISKLNEINYKNACRVHQALSYALESDRLEEDETFAWNIGIAFLATLNWAAEMGYSIEENILAKMEKNKHRPRLHGKKY